MAVLKNWWNALLVWLELEKPERGPGYELQDELDKAVIDLKVAQEFINEVTDPDLTDYGIYRLKSAEVRYQYLVKQAKQGGFQEEFHLLWLD